MYACSFHTCTHSQWCIEMVFVVRWQAAVTSLSSSKSLIMMKYKNRIILWKVFKGSILSLDWTFESLNKVLNINSSCTTPNLLPAANSLNPPKSTNVNFVGSPLPPMWSEVGWRVSLHSSIYLCFKREDMRMETNPVLGDEHSAMKHDLFD